MRNSHIELDFEIFGSIVIGGVLQYLRASVIRFF